MRSDEVRESFLSFFESKGCTRVPSASLVPDDPSMLLTSAGMVQFKPVFLGREDRGYTRATSCQKCARTTDIDTVGHTGRHHTFFEMLGNFSFGDYFKSEACAWAQEYSVEVLGLDPDRIWYSVFEDDDEAADIWRDEVGVPAERIVRLGAEDNFWAAGPTGPCGPCSELYYDQGEELGCGREGCMPGCDCDRYVEYWNLVFMQYDRKEDGTLEPLPKKNIDTGMGLERVAAITQGVRSNFEIDLLRDIIAVGERLAGVEFGASERTDVSLRILADHSRSVAFLIADGVLPSNEGRGYVLRRILRRAVRHGRLLGVEDPFLMRLVDKAIESMSGQYPELEEHRELITGIVESEEERFGATLRQGTELLEERMARVEEDGEEVLGGDFAFLLHDTYGFPIELTAEIASERGLSVDRAGFEEAMEAQRERGRAGAKDEAWAGEGELFGRVAAEHGPTESLCYEADETDAEILAIVRDGELVERAEAGDAVEVVLDRTPFYAEQGGQVGDEGTLASPGLEATVGDTRLGAPGVVVHELTVGGGGLSVGDEVHATVDVMRRERIRRNHTATHLLHWALRFVLGEHVRQSGSFVGPDRLRFDFTHFEAMTPEELSRVERMANAKIMENHPVMAYETSLQSAKESGVTALFGEKYGRFVRVLEVGNFSKELCGGTHVRRTSEIGLLRVLSEGSVGANLRRIEAVTSFDALEEIRREEEVLERAAGLLKSRPEELVGRVEALLERVKEAEKAVEDLKRRSAAGGLDDLIAGAADVGYGLVVSEVDASDSGELRDVADMIRSRLGGGAVVLGTTIDGAVVLLAAGSDDAVAAGFDAGAVIREVAPLVDGRGGGKPSMAQAGGSDAGGLADALDRARELLGAD